MPAGASWVGMAHKAIKGQLFESHVSRLLQTQCTGWHVMLHQQIQQRFLRIVCKPCHAKPGMHVRARCSLTQWTDGVKQLRKRLLWELPTCRLKAGGWHLSCVALPRCCAVGRRWWTHLIQGGHAFPGCRHQCMQAGQVMQGCLATNPSASAGRQPGQ